MIMTNKNTRKNATSNKYWENETPIITETNFGEVHYFKEAGKIQLYPVYEDKDGELKLGRACVWDNNNMEADDAVRLVYALMQGLIDVGVENDAFSDAYSLLGDYINENPIDEDDEEESDDTTLDEEFEDEEYDYSEMSLGELKKLCFEREIEIPKRTSTKTLIKLLEAYDADNADDEDDDEDEEEEIETKFVGKNLVYEDGKIRKANKKVRKVYLELSEEIIEWANYIAEEIAKISEMPTKTQKQKKAQDAVYAELKDNVAEWISEWEDDIADKFEKITHDMMLGKNGTVVERGMRGMIAMIKIVDGMDL